MRLFFFAATAIFIAVLSLSSAACGQDSLNVTRVGELRVLRDIHDLVLEGQYAFVAASTGCHVLDISSESAPREIGVCDSGIGFSIAIVGNRAYVGGYEKLQILDIADPHHPQVINTILQGPGAFTSVAVGDGLLLASDTNNSRVYVFSLADPDHPALIDTVSLYGYSMVIRDSLLYFGTFDWAHGLQIFDIRNPAQFVLVSAIDTLRQIDDLVLRGDSVYVAWGWGGLHIVNVSDPVHPLVVASYRVSNGLDAQNIALDGSRIYVGNYGYGFQIFDISVPGQIHPIPITDSFCLELCRSVSARPNRAFLTTACSSLNILNTSNSSEPVQIGTYATPNEVYRLAASGNYIYIPDASGLSVADVSNPSTPAFVAKCRQSLGDYPSILAHADRIYTAPGGYYIGNLDSFRIFDISNPLAPIQLGRVGRYSCVQTMAFAPNRVYVGYAGPDSSGGRVIDVSNPASPTDRAGFPVADPSCFVVRDSLLFAGTGEGLFIYSITGDWAPIEIGRTLDGWSVSGVALIGNHAYICANGSLLYIVDISTPENPVVLANLPLLHAENIEAIDHQIFIDTQDRGIRIFDATEPTAPVEIGYYSSPDFIDYYTRDFLLRDSLIYVGEGSQLGIYRWLGTSSASQPHVARPLELSLSVYPNPFNPTTMIAFSLPRTERITLTVYDVTGREVQVLEDGVQNAGDYRITFDGSGLSSGIYFARLDAGSFSQTQKLMLLK
jgi:hypothetical protein